MSATRTFRVTLSVATISGTKYRIATGTRIEYQPNGALAVYADNAVTAIFAPGIWLYVQDEAAS